MSSFWTVVGFTTKNKLRTKSFIITTAILAVLLSIGANVPYIISLIGNDDDGELTQVGYVQDIEPEITGMLQAHFESLGEAQRQELVAYPDAGSPQANEQQLREAIGAGEIVGYVMFEREEGAAFPKVTYKSESLIGGATSNAISSGLQVVKQQQAIASANLDAAQLEFLFAPIAFQTAQISATAGAGGLSEDGRTPEERALVMGLVYAVMIVLFMGIFVTNQLVATEITAEKSSRVMEILVTSVSPLTQMFGKIFGMFLVGLLQIGVYVTVFLINVFLPHNQDLLPELNLDFSSIPISLYIYAVLFYLTGYFLFSTLFAAVGSIVSKTEDLGQALMPITLLSIGGFYIGIFGITAPGSTIVEVTSFIPFFAPFAMFLRIGLSDPAFWEIGLSFVLMVVSIMVLGWLSAKIYRTGVLMYGKRPSFKELRKAMKAYKI